MGRRCARCASPLLDDGRCVTCAAEAEGLVLLVRSGYAQVREMMTLLEERGWRRRWRRCRGPARGGGTSRAGTSTSRASEVEAAQAFLRQDWADLLDDPEAAAAAARGLAGVDLDAGGEIACPACGHRFAAQGSAAECPECGLSLGAPSDAAPD